jgi:hypothetical protein
MVLEKDGEEQLDRSCEIRSITSSQEERNILHSVERRKANWIGHILRRNCLLKHVTEGKIKFVGRRGRRRKQLPDVCKETVRYWAEKEEIQDRTICRTGFGRSFESVVRHYMTSWYHHHH